VGSLVLDHLVYAVPALDAAVEDLYRRLGVRAVAGGRHEGLGTYNALVGLGTGAYLEVIAPDPGQPDPPAARFAGVGPASTPRLAGWAVRTDDIDASAGKALDAGFDPGPVVSMTRRRPDGVTLAWRLTWPVRVGDGLIPFLIDWGDSPHPSVTAPQGVTLRRLVVQHPEPSVITTALEALGAEADVLAGDRPALIASLDAGDRAVTLR
jgi:glyoxalase-like protein